MARKLVRKYVRSIRFNLAWTAKQGSSKKRGAFRIDMISGRHRTRNRVIDTCSHVPPSNTLAVLATNGIRLQQLPWTEFHNPNPTGLEEYTVEYLLDADISYHINTYQKNRRLKKKMTLRSTLVTWVKPRSA